MRLRPIFVASYSCSGQPQTMSSIPMSGTPNSADHRTSTQNVLSSRIPSTSSSVVLVWFLIGVFAVVVIPVVIDWFQYGGNLIRCLRLP